MKHNNRVNIDFPVQKHVYKYLKINAGEKLVLSKKGFFGCIVLDMLSKSGRNTVKSYNEMIYSVEISIDYMNRYGIVIDEVTKNKFNKYVDNIFRMELLAHIKICRKHKTKTIHSAVRDFLDLYEITEDELKFETLIKYIQRNLN